MNWKLIIFVALVGYGAYQGFSTRSVEHGSGVMAANEPVQGDTSVAPFELNGYTITPLQSFEVKARVLLTEQYTFDRAADLSPIDLALGWGRMSDEAILEDISISQSRRFFFWRTEKPPIPLNEIKSHAANMHMVPANSTIEKALKSIRTGQIVSIKGLLIKAVGDDGWSWNSSLTRTDTGNGACEIVFVTELSVS